MPLKDLLSSGPHSRADSLNAVCHQREVRSSSGGPGGQLSVTPPKLSIASLMMADSGCLSAFCKIPPPSSLRLEKKCKDLGASSLCLLFKLQYYACLLPPPHPPSPGMDEPWWGRGWGSRENRGRMIGLHVFMVPFVTNAGILTAFLATMYL